MAMGRASPGPPTFPPARATSCGSRWVPASGAWPAPWQPVGSVCAIAPGKARIPVRVKRLFIALGLLLVLALACIVAGGAVLMVGGGVSARTEPTRLEAAIARRLLRMGIPDEYKQL